MDFGTSVLRLGVASLLFALILITVPALAAPIDQAGWSERKLSQALPNGMTLAYVEMGDPKGSPVILLHGWTDSSRSWSLVEDFLIR